MFFVEFKKEVREYQLQKLFQVAEENKPFMIIAENLFPKIKNALTEQGIAFIEANGNMNIETETMLLRIEGRPKKNILHEKQGRAFTKTGLKVVFLFLNNKADINDTHREIAKRAGVAHGNINYILEGLLEEGYALPLNNKELKLTNKEQLLQKWITAYTEKLKPAIKTGNFRFNNPNDFLTWKSVELAEDITQWGGEPAGNIYTEFIQPEYLTLYTLETRSDLLKRYRLLPDPEGNVIVYVKFWNLIDPDVNVVPPIIAYADLLATGKKRCIETAQKIYEQHIENTF
jgi:hypothetical protein